MFGAIVLIFVGILQTGTTETESSACINLEGFTLESWNQRSLWNDTRLLLAFHLNNFSNNDVDCRYNYGINHIHLSDVTQHGLSTIILNITIDKLSSNSCSVFLADALNHVKADIEQLQNMRSLKEAISSSSSSETKSSMHRAGRLLLVPVVVSLITGMTALIVCFAQLVRQCLSSDSYQSTRTCQSLPDELLSSTTFVSTVAV